MEKENISFAEEKKNGEGKGGIYFEEGNIFFCRKTEKEKEEYIWRREIYFLQKNGAGKGGKYLEKENEVNISRRIIYILWGGISWYPKFVLRLWDGPIKGQVNACEVLWVYTVQ